MSDRLLKEALRHLRPRLWHTTRANRYCAIIDAGAILLQPNIPDRDRYGTALGASGYPFVRSLGGVSLFDFHSFDAEDYSARFPMSSWRVFVPYHRDWEASIWIELDRGILANGLIPHQPS